jgi:hypothetical protein
MGSSFGIQSRAPKDYFDSPAFSPGFVTWRPSEPSLVRTSVETEMPQSPCRANTLVGNYIGSEDQPRFKELLERAVKETLFKPVSLTESGCPEGQNSSSAEDLLFFPVATRNFRLV